MHRNTSTKTTESFSSTHTIETANEQDAERYSTLEPIIHDHRPALSEKLGNIPEDKEIAISSKNNYDFFPRQTTRQLSGSTINSDIEKQPPTRKRYCFSLLSRRVFYALLVASLVLIALLALGLGLGLGLTAHHTSQQSVSTASPTTPPSASATTTPSAKSPPSTPSGPCNTTRLSITVTAPTNWGENMLLAGNSSALGSWNPAKALPLDSKNYTATKPIWLATVVLAANETTGYKYVRKEPDGTFTWETQNRTLAVGEANCGSSKEKSVEDAQQVVDVWAGPGAGLVTNKVRRRGGDVVEGHAARHGRGEVGGVGRSLRRNVRRRFWNIITD